jgi:uncharacterized protein YigA (DUF484 family)
MPLKPDPADLPDLAMPAAERVEAYLRRHPEFLAQRPDLMDVLAPPRRDHGDNVADWQAFLIERLRGEAVQARDEADQLVARTRRDRSLQDRVHAGALAMIGAVDLDHLVEIVTSDLAILLGVDVVTLAVETTCPGGQAQVICGVRCVVGGTIERLMEDDHDVIARSPALADEGLFMGASTLVQSEILARFGGTDGLPCGVLALGSRHADHFRQGAPVELYRFLAAVLERCLRKKLGLAL